MERETAFELGVISLGGAVLAGLAIFFGSELVAGLLHGRRHREAPPNRDVVPPERHRHIQAPAPH